VVTHSDEGTEALDAAVDETAMPNTDLIVINLNNLKLVTPERQCPTF
jgi:hypothetical protein